MNVFVNLKTYVEQHWEFVSQLLFIKKTMEGHQYRYIYVGTLFANENAFGLFSIYDEIMHELKQ